MKDYRYNDPNGRPQTDSLDGIIEHLERRRNAHLREHTEQDAKEATRLEGEIHRLTIIKNRVEAAIMRAEGKYKIPEGLEK